jgi:hypothetical protein
MIASAVLETEQFVVQAIDVPQSPLNSRPLSDHSERSASAKMAPEGNQPRNTKDACYRQERNAQISIL